MNKDIFLTNNLSNKKEKFVPIDEKNIGMYVCGPTVYDDPHIGNARPIVIFDILFKILKSKYSSVTYVRNITDVDDKIIKSSNEKKISISDLTQTVTKSFSEDCKYLNCEIPTAQPKATEHIAEMILMIKDLLKKGYAYEQDGHVLFEVSTYEDYGLLSKRNLTEMKLGSRIEIASYKKSAHDFVLWKPSTPDFPGWDSPWGRGRPGWHLECSAMIEKHLGDTIDIHAGGQDLVFPHHENEIAQSTCAHQGKVFSRYWLHNGFLSIDNTKMSKSLGNVSLVRDLLKDYSGEVIRLALLTAHYRQPLEWSEETLVGAKKMLDRIYGSLRDIEVSTKKLNATKVPSPVMSALLNDLNTPMAISEVFNLAKELNKTTDQNQKEAIAAGILVAGRILGLFESDANEWFQNKNTSIQFKQEIESLIVQRDLARSNKDFIKADQIRDKLFAKGVTIEDTPSGVRWHYGSN